MDETAQASSSPTVENYTTGLAFSGGGIRSAALCSGVLRRLLQRGVEPDYLSCVSGGGYTGTAYLDWKYRHNKKDDPTWHKQFFEHMRSRTGLLCNWQKLWQGIKDTCVFILMLSVVCLVIPIVGWGSFACPLALFIDWTFGKYLRAERSPCNETIEQECDFPAGSLALRRVVIFFVFSTLFLFFHILTIKCPTKYKLWFQSLSKIFGLLFAFTFLPWLTHKYRNDIPPWLEAGIFIKSAAIWFFLPVLRYYSSLFIIVYTFSGVIYWHVYDKKHLGVKHTDTLFLWLLFFSGVVWFFASILGELHLRLVYIYYR